VNLQEDEFWTCSTQILHTCYLYRTSGLAALKKKLAQLFTYSDNSVRFEWSMNTYTERANMHHGL